MSSPPPGEQPVQAERRSGHVCPPSDATHPSDRWESLFVYAFICKFTNLRAKVEGLESPADLEDALMSREPNSILSAILVCFILNLKPQTRNISMDQISSTVAAVLAEYLKTSEQTIFWNDDYRVNIDPFQTIEGGFFTADWDFKLKILRQLVELQLTHSTEIKGRIDQAWGVSTTKTKKKSNTSDGNDAPTLDTYQDLHFAPIGQDIERKRYWIVDDSPRIYISTNPWKITSTFKKISTTRDEYIAAIEMLKASLPPPPQGRARRNKIQQAHVNLIKTLEDRIPAIDTELARVQRAKKRQEQKRILLAQAELRETRTRRQTKRPDYAYAVDIDSDEDAEYAFQEEGDEEFEEDFDGPGEDGENGPRKKRKKGSASQPTRRSTRSNVLMANYQSEVAQNPWQSWRGERRSARLGAPPETQDMDPPSKRARTEESTISTGSRKTTPAPEKNVLKLKNTSAAALKPNEVALEQVAGKKKSKFWVYAVEPGPDSDSSLMNGLTRSTSPDLNGRVLATNGLENGDSASSHSMDIDESG